MSSSGRGGGAKRGSTSRRAGRVRRVAPVFRGLDRNVDPAAGDAVDAEAYLAGVDPSVRDDPAAVRALLARRRFAVPTLVTTLEGDEVELDPADEDQRELLIVAEHPQYRDVLDDPFSEELVDGANPRLHVVMHRIITNQLWDDTPPELWQAAKRLLAAGNDRHDVLHALAYELSHELHPVMTGQQAPDPDMTAYRERLRAL